MERTFSTQLIQSLQPDAENFESPPPHLWPEIRESLRVALFPSADAIIRMERIHFRDHHRPPGAAKYEEYRHTGRVEIFENFIVLVIILNVVCLAIDVKSEILNMADVVFVSIYFVELLIRCAAFGCFVRQPRWSQASPGYFFDPWNIVDFIILCLSITDVIVDPNSTAASALRLVRVLRPLRLTTRFPRIRLVVEGLISSIPYLRYVALLYLLFLLLFAVVGVHMYKGCFRFHCVNRISNGYNPNVVCRPNTTITSLTYLDTYRQCKYDEDCIDTGVNPIHGYMGFDNVAQASMVLFAAMSLSNWNGVFYHLLDSNDAQHAPFIIVPVFIGAYVFINLAVAVVAHVYQSKVPPNLNEQPSWPLPKVLERTQGNASWQLFLTNIMDSRVYTVFSALVIGTNCIILALDAEDLDPQWDEIFLYINTGITAFFALELIVQLLAFGSILWIVQSPYNLLDFTVITLGLVDSILRVSGLYVVTVLRAFRVVRLLRFAKPFPQVRKWLGVITSAFSGAFGLLMVLLVYLCGFSLLLHELVGKKIQNPNGTYMRMGYEDLFSSFLTVFQMFTGDNWENVMYGTMEASGVWTAIIIIPFFVIGNYLLLNLFVGILLGAIDVADIHNVDEIEPEDDEDGDDPNAFFLLTFENPIRHACRYIAIENSGAFTAVVTCSIVLNAVSVAMTNPLVPPDAYIQTVLFWIDFSTSVVFVLETIVSSIAYGFAFHPRSYLRRNFGINSFDFALVVLCVIDVISRFGEYDIPYIRTLRAFRSLRPLQFLTKFEGPKIILVAFGKAVLGMRNAILFVSMVWFLFAVFGMQLLKGRMKICSINPYSIFTFDDCVRAGGHWRSPPAHFDHFGAAMQTLFEVGTLNSWSIALWRTVDTVPYGEKSDHIALNNSRLYALFLVVFVIVGAFFMINLFISVFIDAFATSKAATQTAPFLTPHQAYWLEIHRILTHSWPGDVSGIPRWVEKFSGVVVGSCLITLCLSYYPERLPYYEETLAYVNVGFLLLFVVEFFLKIKYVGIRLYWRSQLNRVDFFVTCLSLGMWFAEFFVTITTPGGVLVAVRSLRMIRLLRNLQGVSMLLRTIVLAVPPLLNISLLILIVLFGFACLGRNLFSLVRRDEMSYELSRNGNFDDVWKSFLAHLRIVTTESWIGMSYDLRRDTNCSEKLADCGYPLGAAIYLDLFIIINKYVIFNMFVAILVDSFNTVVRMDQPLDPKEAKRVMSIWEAFDPQYLKGFIRRQDVVPMLCVIGRPLGFPPHCNTVSQRLCFVRPFTQLDEIVPIAQFLKSLMEAHLVYEGDEITDFMLKEIYRRSRRWFPTCGELISYDDDLWDQGDLGMRKTVAAAYVLMWYKRWKKSRDQTKKKLMAFSPSYFTYLGSKENPTSYLPPDLNNVPKTAFTAQNELPVATDGNEYLDHAFETSPSDSFATEMMTPHDRLSVVNSLPENNIHPIHSFHRSASANQHSERMTFQNYRQHARAVSALRSISPPPPGPPRSRVALWSNPIDLLNQFVRNRLPRLRTNANGRVRFDEEMLVRMGGENIEGLLKDMYPNYRPF